MIRVNCLNELQKAMPIVEKETIDATTQECDA